MENDILSFCERIIPHINELKDDNSYQKLNEFISILIKEIRTNDIIYINNKWYQYNLLEKKWDRFNFRLILNQIETFYEFFEEHLKNFLLNSNLNLTNKNFLLNINQKIINFIKNKNYNERTIQSKSSKLFSVK
jgi:hypothetical protein